MADVKEDAGPPPPERAVIPVDDLDKIEKLLDVFMNAKDMPNLPAIKQSCMEELAQIEAGIAGAQREAQEEYDKAMADWEAAKRKKAEEKRKAEEKAEEEKKDAA